MGSVVFLAHIAPGGTSAIDPVTDTHILTTLPNQPWAGTGVGPSGTATCVFIPGGISSFSAGPFVLSTFNNRPGLAVRGSGVAGQSHAYVHFSYHNLQGLYAGAQAPDQNNHLSRFAY